MCNVPSLKEIVADRQTDGLTGKRKITLSKKQFIKGEYNLKECWWKKKLQSNKAKSKTVKISTDQNQSYPFCPQHSNNLNF